jgi:beta-glucanase (GH16 family)
MRKTTLIVLIVLILQIPYTYSCKKETTKIPELTFTSVSINEGNVGETKAKITFTLSEAASSDVTFTYSTVDGTAKAGVDYAMASNASVTISAGEKYKAIELSIIPNTYFEFNKSFQVQIANVKNASALSNSITVTILNDDSYTPTLATDGYITPDAYPGMKLVWSDEFSGTQLNTDWWNYEKGAGGWGNNELENYTDSQENSYLENGNLIIKAIKGSASNSYTSARLTTKGKKEFTYGRIDIRAKLPKGKGIWPALWMLGANIDQVNWPTCGELDIMEFLGHDLATVYGTVHYNLSGHQYKGSSYVLSSGDNFCDKYHIYTLVWQKDYLQWYVDYQKYFEVKIGDIDFTAFQLKQFFIFNVAVGGNWPGNPDDTTVFPQMMTVDYVRVFQ